MKKLLSISLAPNTRAKDAFLALRLFFRPRRWRRGQSAAELEKRFKKYLGVDHAFSFLAGRTALWAALKGSGLGPGDEVLLQSFTCVVVAEAVLALGAKPVWVDIEKDGFNMDPEDLSEKITPKAKAVIVQHTFGRPARTERLLTVARKHRLVVIEDCAQALGVDYRGKKLGTFADLAVFSFGRDKMISSVFGGVLVVNNEAYLKQIKEVHDRLSCPPVFWTGRHLIYPFLTWLMVRTYYLLDLGKVIHWLTGRIGLFNRAVFSEEKKGVFPDVFRARMPESFARLALVQLGNLEEFNRKRRQIVAEYERGLEGKEDGGRLKTYPLLRYPVLVGHPQKIAAIAKKRGIILGDWYRPAVSPEGVDFQKVGYRPETCPTAEDASRRVINLPTFWGLDSGDIAFIIKLVKENRD